MLGTFMHTPVRWDCSGTGAAWMLTASRRDQLMAVCVCMQNAVNSTAICVSPQLQLALQEAEALQQEMKALEGERAGLLRDVALRQEMEAQYAKRGTLQVNSCRGVLQFNW